MVRSVEDEKKRRAIQGKRRRDANPEKLAVQYEAARQRARKIAALKREREEVRVFDPLRALINQCLKEGECLKK